MTERAIFFDLDGTLFDTRRDLAGTVNHTRRDLGLVDLPVDTVLGFVGYGARYLLTKSILEERGDLDFDAVWKIFRSHYAEHCCETLTPYPEMFETLEAFRAAGWKLGVNTSKPNFAVKAIFEKFGLTELFGSAVIAGGDGFALKPNPESLRVCAERLDHRLSPDDWMVGDSHADIRCAMNAGIKGAFCTFGFGNLADAIPTLTISSFGELKTILEG